MTTYYVDSAAGSNTSPYDTWAKAATTINTIAAIAAAGSTLYVASTHNESTAGAVSWNWNGTATNPILVICADKTSGAPPSTIATGGTASVSSANTFTLIGAGGTYFYGLTFKSAATSGRGIYGCGSGGTGAYGYFESCSFQLTGASGTAFMAFGATVLRNCTFKFSQAGQSIGPDAIGFGIILDGGSILSGGTSPTNLFGATNGVVQNFDLSNASAGINLVTSPSSDSGYNAFFNNIKLPASWSGLLIASGVPNSFSTYTLFNNGSGSGYLYHRATQYGDVYGETTIVRSSGASDGTTPLSWKLVSTSSAGIFPATALHTGQFVIWNDSTSSKTVTVEFVHDSVTGLKNNEIWLEVSYLSDSTALGALATSAAASPLATPSTYSSSSTTWTTTGMTNPNKQAMSVTFTPAMKGVLVATVKLAKASYTVYVDQLMT